MDNGSAFDPGSRPSGILEDRSSGFNVGKFLGLTAALAVGAGVGVGAYYGVGAVAASSDSPPVAEPEPEPEPSGESQAAGTGGEAPTKAPAGPKRDVPAVDEPSDPNVLRLDVPDPWGLPGSDAPSPGGGGGGGGGVTQEVF